MRAAVYDRFGRSDVVEVRHVEDPQPRRAEILVRVRAAALNPKDALVRMGKLRFWSGTGFPKRVGYDWAGEVVALGAGTAGVNVGDALYGMIQAISAGSCAELAAVRLGECAALPAQLSFEEAAAIPLAAQTALQALRDVAEVGPGARVLINGASGGVGTFAIQIAKVLGAHVTTTSSARNLELCRELGADDALDYASNDALDAKAAYDAVFDVFGNRRFAQARPALRPGGTYVSTVIRAHVFSAVARSLLGRERARLVIVKSKRADLETIGRYVEQGRLRPILDAVYPLDQIAAAEDRVGSKHARGKVVVRIPG
jgi:NADPH:quinone reductase-like Zn-dependent oxidoreductase